jgi:hypothetical protein
MPRWTQLPVLRRGGATRLLRRDAADKSQCQYDGASASECCFERLAFASHKSHITLCRAPALGRRGRRPRQLSAWSPPCSYSRHAGWHFALLGRNTAPLTDSLVCQLPLRAHAPLAPTARSGAPGAPVQLMLGRYPLLPCETLLRQPLPSSEGQPALLLRCCRGRGLALLHRRLCRVSMGSAQQRQCPPPLSGLTLEEQCLCGGQQR